MAKSKLKARQKAKLNKGRNPIANNTIMRKGGVHEMSRKSKRQKSKSELRNSLSRLEINKDMYKKGHNMWPLICLLFIHSPNSIQLYNLTFDYI